MSEEFYRRDLTGARFEEVDLSGARLRNVLLKDTVIRGAWIEDVEIDAEVRHLVVNGVDVGPLIEAELDRRDPDRRLLRAQTADECRRGWAMVMRRWDATMARARELPEEVLHERVDDEWSFVETLRHLVFATECWALRVIQGDPAPYSPVGLPFTGWEVPAALPVDPGARLELDVVLASRARRLEAVRRIVDGLTDAELERTTEPVAGPGYPESGTFAVRAAVATILREEYLHREFADRDLAVLAGRL